MRGIARLMPKSARAADQARKPRRAAASVKEPPQPRSLFPGGSVTVDGRCDPNAAAAADQMSLRRVWMLEGIVAGSRLTNMRSRTLRAGYCKL